VPGKVGSTHIDPNNILYTVKSTDPPFGQSWQNWKFAVDQGAAFMMVIMTGFITC